MKFISFIEFENKHLVKRSNFFFFVFVFGKNCIFTQSNLHLKNNPKVDQTQKNI